MSRLVVVSNRTPDIKRKKSTAGGLTVALSDVVRNDSGLWFGWSGEVKPERSAAAEEFEGDGLHLATVDLTEADYEGYYHGFANRALWPVFHHRLDLADFSGWNYRTYRDVNAYFARSLQPLLRAGDVIWIHDYHLIPMAEELRQLGVKSVIGFFLHIPVPAPEIFLAIPWHDELRRALTAYDLVGFQAERDRRMFEAYLTVEGVDPETVNCGAFPIGIDPEGFASLAERGASAPETYRMIQMLGGREMIIGVDRLDYSKGLLQRVLGFEEFLENYQEFRNRVCLVQIASPSRSKIPEYVDLAQQLDEACGRVNGHFAELDWTPVQYIRKVFPQQSLAGAYRHARVGLVTPLRDGMNLVAMEYVAAQDPTDPGVLILSKFAGAAERLDGAIIVNPYDVEGVARAIHDALCMPLAERRRRWVANMGALRAMTVFDWRDRFLEALRAVVPGGGSDRGPAKPRRKHTPGIGERQAAGHGMDSAKAGS